VSAATGSGDALAGAAAPAGTDLSSTQADPAPSPASAATPARPRRFSSLRTRSFIVIAACILVPSLCLSALGVWAYYRSWNNAQSVFTDQARYRAFELEYEVESLSQTPRHLDPRERALLSAAIVRQFSFSGHAAGALRGDLNVVADPNSHVLPPWAARSLRRNGYAIGTWKGPSTAAAAQIVAWRVGSSWIGGSVGPGGQVYYYTDYWGDLQRVSARPSPGRLAAIGVYGLILVALVGVIGAWILSRSVVRPVRRLAEASGRLAEGEAGVTVKPEGPRELRELAESFNDMNAKLTKAQEAEQSFLLSVSHELKTPLTSIRGYAEALDDGALPAPEAAAVIETESARLERLVGDLLDSARMRKSAFTVRSETVDLAAVAEEVARRHEATARDACLTLHLKLAPDSLATADHDRVLQVVSNLVENALRCTPAPGSVTVTTAPGLVSVADTGPGLTGDDLPRAFERFYLYSRYGNDRAVGTGLGLAIVKELTEAMDGRVRISSAVGVGTAFVVELPIAAAPVEGGPAADESPIVEAPTVEAPTDRPSATDSPTAAEPDETTAAAGPDPASDVQ
jgi:signal transduction histidine kinase